MDPNIRSKELDHYTIVGRCNLEQMDETGEWIASTVAVNPEDVT